MQVNDHVPFLDSQKVLFSVSDGKTAVHATADGSDPMTAQAAISGGMTLTKTAMVKAAVANPGGVMAPRVSSQRFVAMLPAAKESAEGLVSGLTLTHFQGEEAFREAARSTDRNQQPSAAVQGFDLGPFGRGHVAVLEGYLDVPETGVYNFVSLSYPGINLILDNEKIIEAYGRGDTAWWVQDGRIGLAKGLHRIRVEYHNPTSHPGEVNIEWQGPSTEGGKIPESKLFHK